MFFVLVIKKRLLLKLNEKNMSEGCPVTFTMGLIGGKWKPVILFYLSHRTGRFGEMSRAIEGVSKQMLTKQLREMEADGLITRQVFPEVPPRVEYELSTRGRSLLPVVGAMRDWGTVAMRG